MSNEQGSSERDAMPKGTTVRRTCPDENCFVGDIAITSKGGTPRQAACCPHCRGPLQAIGPDAPAGGVFLPEGSAVFFDCTTEQVEQGPTLGQERPAPLGLVAPLTLRCERPDCHVGDVIVITGGRPFKSPSTCPSCHGALQPVPDERPPLPEEPIPSPGGDA